MEYLKETHREDTTIVFIKVEDFNMFILTGTSEGFFDEQLENYVDNGFVVEEEGRLQWFNEKGDFKVTSMGLLDGGIQIINGRHRLQWMIENGVSHLPIEVEPSLYEGLLEEQKEGNITLYDKVDIFEPRKKTSKKNNAFKR